MNDTLRHPNFARMACGIAALLGLATIAQAQESTSKAANPLSAAVQALLVEFDDLWASDLERDLTGERIVALGAPAAKYVLDAAIAEVRERNSSRLGGLLEAMGEDAAPALPGLLALLEDVDPSVRAFALHTLATVGPLCPRFDASKVPAPPPVDVGGVEIPNPEWQRLQARAAVAPRATSAELIAIVRDGRAAVDTRTMAVELLARRGPAAADALPSLKELRTAAQQGTRTANSSGIDLGAIATIVGAIARISPAEPVALPDLADAVGGPLRGYVAENDAIVAIDKLARLGGPAVPALGLGLTQSRPRVRLASLRALEQIGPAATDALPALDALLARTTLDPSVRTAAERTAAAIHGADAKDRSR